MNTGLLSVQGKTAPVVLNDTKMKKIEESAREFEAVFISEMIKPMFEGLKTDGMFGGGKAEEVFRSIMLQEYGKAIASTNTIGIADHVKAELIKAQAGETQTTTKIN